MSVRLVLVLASPGGVGVTFHSVNPGNVSGLSLRRSLYPAGCARHRSGRSPDATVESVPQRCQQVVHRRRLDLYHLLRALVVHWLFYPEDRRHLSSQVKRQWALRFQYQLCSEVQEQIR